MQRHLVIPPILTNVKVKKIINDEFGNNLILRLKYLNDDIRLEPTLAINLGNDYRLVIKDDGAYPDIMANDKEYAIAINENITNFKSIVTNNLTKIKSKPSLAYYVGYSSISANTENINFDMDAFDAGFEVEMDCKLIAPEDCGSALLKEKSLFITDLSVVEDLARTYNTKYDIGNPLGCWTFGQMIKNIANEPVSGISAKSMLKNWLKSYMNDEYIIDPNNTAININKLENRTKILDHLIIPWISKCIYKEHYNIVNGAASLTSLVNNGNGAVLNYLNYTLDANNNEISNTSISLQMGITVNNWESIWDDVNLTEAQILKYAPFKLMAISNRIDMRSNRYYSNILSNYRGGETRFVFTLINLTGDATGKHAVGIPPIHHNPDFPSGANFYDWEGMNVILEYGNTSKDLCEEKGLGQEWLDLSDLNSYPVFPLPLQTASNYVAEKVKSNAYNAALQLITDKVTKIHADTRRIGNNYSAINQIRTNEKLFHDKGLGLNNTTWNETEWELRQFEISSVTHNLTRVNVTNVPTTVFDPNSAYNSASPTKNSFNINNMGNNEYNMMSHNYLLLDWIKSKPGKASQIIFHNFNLPNAYPNNISVTNPAIYNAPSAIMHDERHTYQEIWTKTDNDEMYATWVLGFNNKLKSFFPQDNNEQTARRLRHGVSISTCQGCHGGDTKTAFTMIHPRGYGQSAIYWTSTPDVLTTSSRMMDTRFESNTKQQIVENDNHPIVASFITGSPVNGGDDLQDGGQDDAKDLYSNVNDYTSTIKRGNNKFFVDDPSDNFDIIKSNGGSIPGYPQYNSPVNGSVSFLNTKLVLSYNELDRRRVDMCNLLSSNCNWIITQPAPTTTNITNGSIAIKLIKGLSFYPTKM